MALTVRNLEIAWGALVGLTVGGAAFGESVDPGFWTSVAIAAIMLVKGRLVIDQFLELGSAHPAIRRWVRLFGLAVPLFVVVTYLFGPQIAALTQL